MLNQIVAIIQARMNSSRLPGKVLLDIDGDPMLAHVVARVSRAKSVDHIILATTNDISDIPIIEFCQSKGIEYTRGSQDDVLDRYFQTAVQVKASVLVRITADCPVIDPALIDDCVNTLVEGSFDFTCNRLPPPWGRTYPIGMDTEVCTFAAIEKAWTEATEKFHREHVMPYLYEGVELKSASLQRSEGISLRGFKIAQLNHEPNYGNLRWTVDTPEDLEFMRQLYNHFNIHDDFSWKDILQLVLKEPGLAAINSDVKHKSLYDD